MLDAEWHGQLQPWFNKRGGLLASLRRRQIPTAAIRSIGAVFSLTWAVKGHMS